MPSTTLTYTAQVGTDFATALGRERNLRDVSNVPRAATAAECKKWIVDQVSALIKRQDYAAKAEAIVPIADPVIT